MSSDIPSLRSRPTVRRLTLALHFKEEAHKEKHKNLQDLPQAANSDYSSTTKLYVSCDFLFFFCLYLHFIRELQ